MLSANPLTAVGDQGPGFATDEDTPVITASVLDNDLPATGDGAPVFSASIAEFSTSTGSCGAPIDEQTGAGDVDAHAMLSNNQNGSASADVSATAGGGVIGGSLTANANGNQTNFTNSIAACFESSMVIDDIVITGPDPEVTATLSVDISGIFDTNTSATLTIANVEMFITFSGPTLAGGNTSTFKSFDPGSTADATVYDSTVTTAPITVATGQPLTAEIILEVRGSARSNAFSGPSDLSIDFAGGVSFTQTGDVLSLPAGFTANSIAGNIIDNQFVPGADELAVIGFDTTNTIGVVTHNGDGTFDYDPNGQFEQLAAGETATDTFEYTLGNGRGDTDTATVAIQIDGLDDPVAIDIEKATNGFDADTPPGPTLTEV